MHRLQGIEQGNHKNKYHVCLVADLFDQLDGVAILLQTRLVLGILSS